jgi:hypothetical protein
MTPLCTEITEWIRETYSKPVEDWEEQNEKKCKKRHWYDPRSWLCWFVTIVVKVFRWIVITVVTAVVTLVCKSISMAIGIFLGALKSLGLFFVALVTWDKCTAQEALLELGNVVIDAFLTAGYVISAPIVDWVQGYRLQNYVKDRIEAMYQDRPDVIEALENLFHTNGGVFGYRVQIKIYRLYVDSRTKSPGNPTVNNLFDLHRQGEIDVYELAGFHTDPDDCTFFDSNFFDKKHWYRPRPQTAVYPFAGGGGLGEPTPPSLKREQLDQYISSGGESAFHFFIYAMENGNLQTRLDAAKEKGRQIGLIPIFRTADIEVTESKFMFYEIFAQENFLSRVLNRNVEPNNGPENPAARKDLYCPAGAGMFRFKNKMKRGLTSNLFGTTGYPHDLSDDVISGVTFIDDIPDEIRKYVLIHELGHFYGLTHVDGFDRLMVSGEEGQGDWFTWQSIPNSLFFGGPRFTFSEAQRVWDFILTKIPLEYFLAAPDCFRKKEPPVDPQSPVIL